MTGFEPEDAAAALAGAAVLLVEPCFAAPSGLFLGPGAAAAARAATRSGVPIWAVLGPGRLLSETLAAAASSMAREAVSCLPADSLALVVDEQGASPAHEALARPGCPPGGELTRL